ncbi:hypothetical protein AV903_12300 [Erwinia tracheiphila]|uniref:Uncharacterized protein n=2 Tax=Erwinia tracheiphila TaxID=65700 RepID=A0A345CT79_9GAMM|nr:hypothetical protein AV903_12300 [Erwinia tracheiphila]
MSKETGGPAFAQSGFVSAAGQSFVSEDCGGAGMTLRDYFAAEAINGILSDSDAGLLDDDLQCYAGISYRLADAMLEARK